MKTTEASVRVDGDTVILTVAEFSTPGELASRLARGKLTADEALTLAATLIHAAADVMEQELAELIGK